MFSVIIASLLVSQGDVTVRTVEPSPPVEQSQWFRARCGKTMLEVRNFGVVRPAGKPGLTVNGAALRGSVGEATTFLAAPEATYRFSVQCPNRPGTIELQIYRTRTDRPGGTPTYDAMGVRISAGAVTATHCDAAIDASAFYFR